MPARLASPRWRAALTTAWVANATRERGANRTHPLSGAVDVRTAERLRIAGGPAGGRELHDRARVRDQPLPRELLGLAPRVRVLAEVDDRAVRVADRPGDVAGRRLDLARDREAVVDADDPDLGPRGDLARGRTLDVADL